MAKKIVVNWYLAEKLAVNWEYHPHNCLNNENKINMELWILNIKVWILNIEVWILNIDVWILNIDSLNIKY